MKENRIAKVIFPIALNREFDYLIPQNLIIRPGMRVIIDFRGRKKLGFIIGTCETSKFNRLKSIIETIDTDIILGEKHLKFAQQLTNHYFYNMGEFIFMMLPKPLRTLKKTNQPILLPKIERISVPPQKTTYIKGDTIFSRYPYYKKTILENLKNGSVILCFPQRSYIEALQTTIKNDFPKHVVIHSNLSEKDILMRWIESREKSLIIGTRVSLFYFPQDLQQIIIEEENNPHYFQEEKPFYHLVDVAKILQETLKIPLTLCGNYPMFTDYPQIKNKTIELIETDNNKSAPAKVIDITTYRKKGFLHPLVIELLRRNIEENKKSVVLYNRKGFASYISCSSCKYTYTCSRCSSFLQVSLENTRIGVCPYCHQETLLPEICTECNNGYIKNFGAGIERISLRLKKIFPEAKIDQWETHNKESQIIIATSKILSDIYSKPPQTYQTGFLLDIDTYLSHIDYETTMHNFFYIKKLLYFFTEALYIFTRNHAHALFKHLDQPWQMLYENEQKYREELKIPPFGKIIKIVLRHNNKNHLSKKAKDLYNNIKKFTDWVYGPLQETPFQLRGMFRLALVVKTNDLNLIKESIQKQLDQLQKTNFKIATIIR